MKLPFKFWLALACVAAAIVFFILGKQEKQEIAGNAKRSIAPVSKNEEPVVSAQAAPSKPPADPSEAKAAQTLPKEQVLASISDASVSYDAKELPKIEPYLVHPDPEVRAAALQGMLVLGDAAASPMLRAASKQTSNPREAVRLLEAADYLELPSGSMLNKHPASSKAKAR